MMIHRQQLLSGASRARGTTVVFDVLRASTNIVTLLERGAARILPATTLAEARDLAAGIPGSILAGERGGLPPPGFDLGNSPVEAARLDVAGKTIVLTTSAGSGGIAAAIRCAAAKDVLIGCFRNARAVADHILRAAPHEVTLVAMGTGGERAAPEDDLAAEYVAALLRGVPADVERMFREVRAHPEGQKFLDPAIAAYPREDLEYCLVADVSACVPRVAERDPPAIRRCDE